VLSFVAYGLAGAVEEVALLRWVAFAPPLLRMLVAVAQRGLIGGREIAASNAQRLPVEILLRLRRVAPLLRTLNAAVCFTTG
jgi:hypothetical protein